SFHCSAGRNRNAAGEKSCAGNDGERRSDVGFAPGGNVAFAKNGGAAGEIWRGRPTGPSKNQKHGDARSGYDRDKNSGGSNAAAGKKVFPTIWARCDARETAGAFGR